MFWGTAAMILLSSLFIGVAKTNIFALYTDPGSGALLWQLLIAGFLSGLFYLRRAKDWFMTARKQSKQAGVDKPEYPSGD